MRGVLLAAAAVLIAGCSSSGPGPAIAPAPLPGLEPYLACPVQFGDPVPCEPGGDNPMEAILRDSVPPGWSCLTFSDDRFVDDGHPFPHWYTYYGPYLGDGLGLPENRVGILYDVHNDTRGVTGAAVLVSEDEQQVYTWNGPARGFVVFPVPVTQGRVLLYGVLAPAGPGDASAWRSDAEPFGPPRFEATGDPSVALQPFWSQRPLVTDGQWAGWGGEPKRQWSMVLNGELAGRGLHIPTDREARIGFGDPAAQAGTGHWGEARAAPFNATVRADGLTLDASLQPYMEFYAEFRDLSPVTLALIDWMCGCGEVPMASVEGVFCTVGAPPPIATLTTSPGGHHHTVRLD